MTTTGPTLSLVIPVYCEESGLAQLTKMLSEQLPQTGLTWECIFVDDGSSDGTWAQLVRLGQDYPWLRALRLSRNFGKESALCAGIEAARGELVLVMDADLEHPPELLPTMVRRWQETGANVVEAVKRRARQESAWSKLRAAAFYRLFRALSGFDLGGHTDYKLFDSKVRQAWLQLGERTLFFRGLVAWLGFQREHVEFVVPDLAERRSRWTLWMTGDLALRSLTSFSSLPLHFVTLLGLVFLAFGTVLGIQTLVRWASGNALEGFSTVILLQLITSSAILVGLGLIGVYIARIYDEVKARPRYVLAERLESS